MAMLHFANADHLLTNQTGDVTLVCGFFPFLLKKFSLPSFLS
jgi:hypothetical protein